MRQRWTVNSADPLLSVCAVPHSALVFHRPSVYYRYEEYFQLIRDAYEGLAIAAFLVLILLYLSTSPAEQREVIATKEKRKLMFPLCCWRFRPSKPKFLVNVKWSVLQVRLGVPSLGARFAVAARRAMVRSLTAHPHAVRAAQASNQSRRRGV